MATLKLIRGRKRQRLSTVLWLTMSTLAGTVTFAQESEFAGLVRGKTQDRGSYVPPSLPRRETQSQADSGEQWQEPLIVAPRPRNVATAEVYEGDNEGDSASEYEQQVDEVSSESVAPASYQPRQPQRSAPSQAPRVIRRAGHVHQPMTVHEHSYEDQHLFSQGNFYGPACGMEGMSCDGGCDSMCGGCDSCGGYAHVGPLGLFCHTNQWFGAAEVMLMFRSGDRLPVLATGVGNAVLFGGQRYYDDMTAGGRFKIGTWLDPYHCNSLVFRGWGAGNESFNFSVNDTQSATIGRPFLNLSPTAPNPPNDRLLIASPTNNLTGTLAISGNSEVYGGDIAIHRQWQAGLGGVIEVLYGYQHMRLNEDLNISSTSFDADDAIVIDRTDFFRADNEFHGGEFGFATRYREGCWSFDGMIKVAAGSINRTATLDGVTVGLPPGDGLLVQQSNQGRFSNRTFGWIPELDATIGYRYTQNLDFTIGYHVIAMTDSLQVSGTLDPQLGVNSDFPNSLPARPAFLPTYDTFYVQSIHFGLQYVY
ncbi:MAG TPA: hypothetical protein DDZ51_19995 [Planctomycetaceae bacterium]|nr:hypothetical protein [Planctomycetaceae bacterium]